jgi:hypothetical protein
VRGVRIEHAVGAVGADGAAARTRGADAA